MLCELCGGRKTYRATITQELPCIICKGTGLVNDKSADQSAQMYQEDGKDNGTDRGDPSVSAKRRGRPRKSD